jgi:hypothetical protein
MHLCLSKGFRSTVTRFVSISAKFGTCTFVGLNRTLVEAKIRTFKCPELASTSVPFRRSTVQMTNLAPVEAKRITVRTVNSGIFLQLRTGNPFMSITVEGRGGGRGGEGGDLNARPHAIGTTRQYGASKPTF